jgi:hypothetical protein
VVAVEQEAVVAHPEAAVEEVSRVGVRQEEHQGVEGALEAIEEEEALREVVSLLEAHQEVAPEVVDVGATDCVPCAQALCHTHTLSLSLSCCPYLIWGLSSIPPLPLVRLAFPMKKIELTLT